MGHQISKISFEFFPPNTPEAMATLEGVIARLATLNPAFVSVTYGAGGSTRTRSLDLVRYIAHHTKLKSAAHLTCVGASRQETDEIIATYEALGVRHIVALRGDAVSGVGAPFVPHADGYQNAVDLINAIAKRGHYEISVSAYPERHPDSLSFAADIDWLKAKVDAGATQVITQFFFENAHFYRFCDAALARGIKIPLIPGLVVAENFRQIANFAKKAGASVPAHLAEKFDGLEHDAHSRQLIAFAHAHAQLEDLAKNGVSQAHFYTLNRADSVFALCQAFGHRAAVGDDIKSFAKEPA